MMNTGCPQVSVIVPVRNEEGHVASCIRQLSESTYPKDKLEILVVYSRSADRTVEIVRDIIKGSQLNIRLLDDPKGQRTSALNMGIKNAAGEVILRIDARTIIPSDYIEKCVKTLLETGADNVGGVQRSITSAPHRKESPVDGLQTQSADSRRLTQEATGIAMSHPFGVGGARFRIGKRSGYVDTLYLGCFRREVFDKVGLFDEEAAAISEDSDMNQRIRNAGGKVYLNKDIVAYYIPRDNFKDLWKLYFRYGGCKAGNFIKSSRLTAWRQLVPPTFLSSLVVLPTLSFANDFFFFLWLFIVGTYLFTDCSVSLYLSLKHKEPSLFYRLFVVFPTMHFSWAIGFWRRIFQRPRPGEYWEN